MVGIFVVVSIIVITIIIAIIIVKRYSRTKQTDHIGMALSNQVYCKSNNFDSLRLELSCILDTPERDQLNATYACLDSSGLYAVNPLDQVNQHAYAEVGLVGQEKHILFYFVQF